MPLLQYFQINNLFGMHKTNSIIVKSRVFRINLSKNYIQQNKISQKTNGNTLKEEYYHERAKEISNGT